MAYYLDFNGGSERVAIPQAIPNGTTSFRIDYDWTPTALTLDYNVLFSNDTTVANSRHAAYQRSNGELEIGFIIGGARRVFDTVGAGLTVGVRKTLTIIYDGTTLSAQIDGNPVGSVAASGTVSTVIGGVDVIGSSQSEPSLNGDFYSMSIEWDGGNNRTYDPSASNGTGSTLIDTVGANNGTLVNFPTDDSQWVWYSQFALDPTQWTRRVNINPTNPPERALVFDGVNDEVNLPLWEPSTGDFFLRIRCTFRENGMVIDHSGDFANWILCTTNRRVNFRLNQNGVISRDILMPTGSNEGDIVEIEMEGISGTGTYLRVFNSDRSLVNEFLEVNATPKLDRLGRYNNGLFYPGNIYFVDLQASGDNRYYDPAASNETTLVDTLNPANNGTLTNFEVSGNYIGDPLTGFTALITEANLPAEIWTEAESSENYLRFSAGNQVTFPQWSVIGTDDWELKAKFTFKTAINSIPFGDTSAAGSFIRCNTNGVVTVSLNYAGLNSARTFSDGELVDLRVEHLADGTLNIYFDGSNTPDATRTAASNFSLNIIARDSLYDGDLYYLQLTSDADSRFYNPAISNDTTLVDEINPANNGTLVNFPASGNYFFTANGGGDLRLCLNSDGTSQLPLEIVSFDTQAQKAVIWTRFPSFASGTSCWLFYGKAGETQPPVTDTFGRNAVFQDMLQAYLGNDLKVDVSGNAPDGTFLGSAEVVSSDANGIYTALNGSGDAFKLGSKIGTQTEVTLTTLHRHGDLSVNGNIFAHSDFQTGSRLYLGYDSAERVFSRVGSSAQVNSAPISTGLHHTAGVISGGQASVIVDGAEVISPYAYSGNAGSLNEESAIGAYVPTSLAPNTYYTGDIYNVFIHNRALSADYISTEYTNQSSPNTFWSTGTPENTTGGVSSRTGSLDITLDDVVGASIATTNITGSLDITLDSLIASSVATTNITGSLDITLDDVTVDGSTSTVITSDATLDITLDDVVGASIATTNITGSLDITLDSLVASSVATTNITGSLDITLDDVTVDGIAVRPITGSLDITLDDVVLEKPPVEDEGSAYELPKQDGYLDDDEIILTAMAFLKALQ